MKKWNWETFGLSAAISTAFVLLLSVLFSWFCDSIIVWLSVATMVFFNLWKYNKNADGMNDYSAVSFLLGGWLGAFASALAFIVMML